MIIHQYYLLVLELHLVLNYLVIYKNLDLNYILKSMNIISMQNELFVKSIL